MVKREKVKGGVCKGLQERGQGSLISQPPGHVVTEPTTQEKGCRKPAQRDARISTVGKSVGAKYHFLLTLPLF